MKALKLNRIRLYQSIKGFDGKQHNHFATKDDKAAAQPGTMRVDMYLSDHMVYIQDRETKKLLIVSTTNIGEMEPLDQSDSDLIVANLKAESEPNKPLMAESNVKAGAAKSKVV